jgi:hypothetical protein
MEKWNRFLAERAIEINEATEEQIETVKIANIEALQDIPIEDYPFGDIFGNSYRIIEPLVSYKKGSDVGKIVKMLAALGWEVNTPTDLKYDEENRVVGGKIPCTKTKVMHFIDGKGEQGVSRRTITLDMYKCIDGIVKFINGGYENVESVYSETLTQWAKELQAGDKSKLIYTVDPRIIKEGYKVSKEVYRNLMKYYDAANHWLGFGIEEVIKYPSSKFESHLMDRGVYSRDLEEFKKTKLESPKERYSLMADFETQMDKHYVIFSRHPIDVYRMSDFEGLGSCHTPPGMPYYSDSESNTFYNEHNICALAEAHGNGMIAYAVPVKEFQDFPPTQESLDNLGDEEIFYDENRPDADGELNPSARIRIKNVNHHDENNEATALAVPSTVIYGAQLSGFKDLVMKKFAMLQKEKLSKIAGNKEAIFMNEFTRYGGSWQDSGHNVSDALPKMFSAAGVDLRIQGSSVMYDQDFENNIKQTFGQDQKAYVNEKLNEIFDHNTGGGISFNWNVSEDYDGSVSFTWKMKVLLYFPIPKEIFEDRKRLNAIKAEVQEIIEDTLPEYFPSDYYPISSTDDITVGKTRDGKLMVLIGYPGCEVVGDYMCGTIGEELLDAVTDATRKMHQVFEVYAEDSGYNMIIHELQKRGHLPSEEYKLQSISNEYGLEHNAAYWPTEETEYKEHDYFGGEYLESITFKDSNYFHPDIILSSLETPENLMEPAYTLIAQFLNAMEKSKEMTSKIVLGIEDWNPKEHPTISIEFLSPTVEVSADEIKNMVEEEDEIEYELTAKLHNDYPSKVLKSTAAFLVHKDSFIYNINDKIVEKLKQFITNNIKKQLTENKKRIKIRVRR